MNALTDAPARLTRGARLRSEKPRRGAKRTLVHTMREIPHYLRLLGGLFTDRRVAVLDKVLVGAAIAYVVSPLDFIPDAIPFLGQVDDIFLITTALQRLIANAGRHVLLDHWRGDRASLSDLNIESVVAAATFFLPLGMRRKLKGIGRK
ncbi:MAG: hypothetical protein AVDCRST_MAG40-2815 [uncultured Gemmatimonadaceae bacterium]|uniref:DUF1232 domain-containing protein n=1 Tax=uncultured Gemmatimonadaceae bacterium TaxID=246130 RepID=A0A6J4M3K8_9BACT|nr:MAG: hypothetical protein AVDCRST_MAG40-2815 [uncultured Gemmatimonadaceae bacterium]